MRLQKNFMNLWLWKRSLQQQNLISFPFFSSGVFRRSLFINIALLASSRGRENFTQRIPFLSSRKNTKKDNGSEPDERLSLAFLLKRLNKRKKFSNSVDSFPRTALALSVRVESPPEIVVLYFNKAPATRTSDKTDTRAIKQIGNEFNKSLLLRFAPRDFPFLSFYLFSRPGSRRFYSGV